MNKYAAEKIAREYYNIGIKLAFQRVGLIKAAKPEMDFTEGLRPSKPSPKTKKMLDKEKYEADENIRFKAYQKNKQFNKNLQLPGQQEGPNSIMGQYRYRDDGYNSAADARKLITELNKDPAVKNMKIQKLNPTVKDRWEYTATHLPKWLKSKISN